MASQSRQHLFLVGPASVGKSTVGRALAKHLGWDFCDADEEFNSRIGNITQYIESKGYESYARQNSVLVADLVKTDRRTVVSLPAGFLVHESVPDLIPKNIELLRQHGLTILLLPSINPEDTADLIAARQLERWGHVPGESERNRYIRRFYLYIKHGDIKVFSMDTPHIIAKKIEDDLNRHPEWIK